MGIMDDLFGIDDPSLDVGGTANTQYKYNLKALQDSLKYGAIGQSGPFGATEYTRDANGIPIGQKTTLSPEMQAYYGDLFSQAGLSSDAVASLMGKIGGGVDTSGIPDTSALSQTAYNRQLGLLKPQFEDAETKMSVGLANRGIPVGSEVWNKEMDRYQRQKEASLTNAAQTADLAATTEQQRQFQNQLSQYGANTGAMSALNAATPNLTGQTPTAISTPWMQAAAPDYSGLVSQKYAADKASADSSMKGLSSLAGTAMTAAMMFSDENMKEDRRSANGEYILMAFDDMPVDNYRYKDAAQARYDLPDHRTGPMAQDYAEHFPEGSDGHMIDMGDMVGKLMAAVKALEVRTHGMAPKSRRA